MTFLLSTGIVFYAIVSALFTLRLWGTASDYAMSKLDPIVYRSETLSYLLIVFGFPLLFFALVIGWPVLMYLQIRKEWSRAD